MMMRILRTTLFVLLSVPFSASALMITFDPVDQTVQKGDIFDINIIGTGFNELAGGTIDLGYDDNFIEILSVTVDPYWDFLPSSGSNTSAGLWTGISFDAFINTPASGAFIIATASLSALEVGVSPFSILGSSALFSSTDPLSPNIVNGTIAVVPLSVAVPEPNIICLFVMGLIGVWFKGTWIKASRIEKF